MQVERSELDQLAAAGYEWQQPWQVVDLFEKKIAEFYGAPYCVAVDCCTHALELSVLLCNQPQQEIQIPVYTYMSVPMMLTKIRQPWRFHHRLWLNSYQLDPLPIIDAATLWQPQSYVGGTLQCVSFQFKKHIPIGRGGAILTDNKQYYDRLQKMCRDGRNRELLQNEDMITEIGYHYYMTPEDAARGVLLFDLLHDCPAQAWTWENYKPLTDYPVFATLRAGVPA